MIEGRKAPSALPALVLWKPKGEFEGPLDRWMREAEKDMERAEGQPKRPPCACCGLDVKPLSKGASLILKEFEAARADGGDGWIAITDIRIRTGLQAVSTRISELHKHGHRTEWNHRSGTESKHRLARGSA